MKGTIGWSRESSENAGSHQSSHSVFSLYGRFKSVLELQHSQQYLALTFLSSETTVKDLKLLTQLSALPAFILVLQNKKQDRKPGRLWPKQSVKQFTARVEEHLKRDPLEENCTNLKKENKNHIVV